MRQGAADARSVEISRGLGRGLKDARLRSRLTQAAAADLAGLAQSTWSAAELGKGENYTVETWTRMARAVGSDLNAYLSRATAADRPRDEVHLRHQELLIRTATAGRWGATFEAPLGDPLHGSRSADTLLRRGPEIAIIEIFDWFDDVGAAARAWDRKVARVEARALSRPQTDEEAESLRVGGCWVVRATRRNRELVGAHRAVFRARFPGSGAWLRALSERAVAMPREPALLWVSVNGDRLWPARLYGGGLRYGAGRMGHPLRRKEDATVRA